MLELYNHQKAMHEPMRERKNTHLLVPCGSGKTLAVVHNWLKERPTKHLIYVLPTTTLLKSIKQDIIELIEGKEGKPDAVKELGYRIVDLEHTEFSDPKLISITTDYGEERESELYARCGVKIPMLNTTTDIIGDEMEMVVFDKWFSAGSLLDYVNREMGIKVLRCLQ